MTLFGPSFTLFLQGEAGEAGNPGPHGEPGAAVSAVSCWSMQIISYIFLTLTKFPGRLTVILLAFSLVLCLVSLQMTIEQTLGMMVALVQAQRSSGLSDAFES